MMWIMTIIFILIDLISKYIVTRYLELNEGISVIKHFLSITYVRNTGVAFSMLPDNKYLVILVALFVIIFIIRYVIKYKPKSKLERVSYALILGGSIGNLINRIVCGYVTDFIDIKIFGYDYPIFNLADTFIVIGVVLLLIYTWRCKDGNNRKRG